jgi:hypothetical protein
VDVGGFAEPRKILCQCALPSDEQVSVHPRSAHGVPENPNKAHPLDLLFNFLGLAGMLRPYIITSKALCY